MTSMTDPVQPVLGVSVGVDTHVAAAIDLVGRPLGDRSFPATAAGYRALWAWARQHGSVHTVGIEGTGAYGAGLCTFLLASDAPVVEVDRPDRKTAGFRASPTRSTPTPPPVPRWRAATGSACPRPAPARSR